MDKKKFLYAAKALGIGLLLSTFTSMSHAQVALKITINGNHPDEVTLGLLQDIMGTTNVPPGEYLIDDKSCWRNMTTRDCGCILEKKEIVSSPWPTRIWTIIFRQRG
ncbi:MAG: hypothetical protein AAGA18_15770 [Verrucomicrobiota bacterium]